MTEATDVASAVDSPRLGAWAGLKVDAAMYPSQSPGPLGSLTLFAQLFTNPQLRACFLIRLAARPPLGSGWIWRNLLITLHSIDVREGAVIGPGLRLPHPYGIAIPATARIGKGVSFGHNVTLLPRTLEGEDSDAPIVISDGVKVFTNSTVIAGVTVGENAVIGSHALVATGVEPSAIVRAHTLH